MNGNSKLVEKEKVVSTLTMLDFFVDVFFACFFEISLILIVSVLYLYWIFYAVCSSIFL